MNYKILLNFILLWTLLNSCQNKSKQAILADNTAVYNSDSANTATNDSLEKENQKKFEEFYSKIPDLQLPFNFEKSKIKKVFDPEIGQNIYGIGDPLGKIVRTNFIAILYNSYSSDDACNLKTFSKSGHRISEESIYHEEICNDDNDKPDMPKMTIENVYENNFIIDTDLKMTLFHTSKKVQVDTIINKITDTLKTDIQKKYYKIDLNGIIKKN